ncbi:MAG: 50S ribosomal protein L30 [Acidimicrobiia bacterium]|nr:50S ribosomal protein L30 [Acidimicrobiia bacterium]
MTTLHVVQIKSSIGIKPKQRGTLRALGLHGIGTNRDHTDCAVIRGMIAKVPHLISVEETS